MKLCLTILVLSFLNCLWTGPGRADWINLTGAETSANIVEIYIEEDGVRVVLEAHIGDLDVFRDLVPEEWLKTVELAAERLPLSERMRRFSLETLRIETPDGETLQAVAVKIEPRLRQDRQSKYAGMINPYTRQRVPDAPADKRVLYAELSYAFPGGGPPPEALTIVPPLDEQGRARVTIGFIAYHKTVPVIDFRYLGSAAKVQLNWDDPWYTKFDNPNLKRHHKDALMSFLYIEPREVRHEVLVRVRDLQEWTDLGLAGGGKAIGPDARLAVKQQARRFFETGNPLQIDGKPVKPASSRAEFLKISLSGLQLVEADKPLDLSTAVLGVILSYPVGHLPRNVSVEWALFNRRIGRIPVTMTDPAGPFRTYIDSESPNFGWQNFLHKYVEPKIMPVRLNAGYAFEVPVASLILVLAALIAIWLMVRPRYASRYAWAGVALICAASAVLLQRAAVIEVRNPFAGPPAEATAAKIITAVLDNVHTAYLERTKPELNRALGVVVTESGYTDIKTELSRALAIKVAGGGIARVNAIEALVVKDLGMIDGRSGFRAVAEWTALAHADHWGHAHRRRIRFRALMELEQLHGLWKLNGLTVVDARRES